MRFLHCLILCLFVVKPSLAHELRPAILSVEFAKEIQLVAEVNLESILAGIGPGHDNTDDSPNAQRYRELRDLSPTALAAEFAPVALDYASGQSLTIDGQPVSWRYQRAEIPAVDDTRLARKSRLYFSAGYPTATPRVVSWQSAWRYGDTVLNLTTADGQRHSHWLKAGESSPRIALSGEREERQTASVFADYVGLGFIHIVPEGVDHILFVLGLFLLSRKLGPLLWQITAFTLAHSVTLALSIYGIVSLPPSLVEPLIALSIAYVGIENILTRRLMPWRVILVFTFGLLHGMGFAGVLTDLGLPETEFVTALIAFNVGVELGQLSVVLAAFLLVFAWWRREQLYRRLVVLPVSLMISLVGLYWFVTRL
jgi:hypothetical protein